MSPTLDDTDTTGTQDPAELSAAARARRAWAPEASAEVAALLRLLAWRCWLVSARDDDAIAAVRRNQPALRDTFGRLGWLLIVERDLVRLRKSPPPRPAVWAAGGPDARTCSWFFLLVAAAEGLAPRVALAQLATAARAAAAEAGLPTDHTITERRALVAALKLLDDRGVIEPVEGEVDGYLVDDNAPVLLVIHHTRLLHVIANGGAADPAGDPHGWLAQVHREPDAPRRMRRRLVDDAVVHNSDLDDAEADWLSRRLRGDDGGPLAAAFGLEIERRAEGAAFVVPEEEYRYDRELGPAPFPVSGGTVPHAALLLCDHAAGHGRLPVTGSAHVDADGPGPGWRGLTGAQVLDRLTALAAAVGAGRGGWSAELVENPDQLAVRVRDLLATRDLVRVLPDTTTGTGVWWFSPATGRWPVPEAASAQPRTPDDPATPDDSTTPTPAAAGADQTLFDAPEETEHR